MLKRKLISLFIGNPMENQIIITLLKDGISYILRIEYLCDDDKIALNNELRLIKDVLNEKKIKHSIDIFSSPQSCYSPTLSMILYF